MKKISTLLLCLTLYLTALAAGRSVDEIPNVHVADRTQYVSNPDGVLSPDAVSRLNTILADVWKSSTAEPIVVVVSDIDRPDDIDGFATDLFEKWRIGKSDKDNGVLILVALDSRNAVIRTGKGMEGPLPDIIAGRILRNVMFPRFREGDYDGGVIAATEQIAKIATDPQYAADLRSRYANDSHASSNSDFDADEFWSWLLRCALFIGASALVIVIFIMISSRNKDSHITYRQLSNIKMPLIFASCISLGAALPALLLLLWRMKRIRMRPRLCPNCNTKMKRLDEQSDNAYLTPAQDAEERYDSVDYDVWLCPNCNETDIIPYVNRKTSYTTCNRCGARLCTLTADRTVVKPTTTSEGRGVRTYTCLACGNRRDTVYRIAKLAVPPVMIIPGGGSGLGGGGGFSGGSFGGGSTMGGGASGSW